MKHLTLVHSQNYYIPEELCNLSLSLSLKIILKTMILYTNFSH